MRILICNYEYPPLGGGGGVVTAVLAGELARRHKVTVLTSKGPELPADAEENGVRVVRVPVFFRRGLATANVPSMLAYIPSAIMRGKRVLREERFDIVNTHFVLPTGPVGGNLSRSAGVPNVLSVHGGDLYDPSKLASPHRHWVLRSWIRGLVGRADRVIAQSTDTLGNLRRFYRTDFDAALVPLGIARPEFTPSLRSEHGFSEDDVLLTTVGRLVGRKAVDQLVALLSELRDERTRLVVIGAGPRQQSLQEEARRLGVESRVHFMTSLTDTEKFQVLQMSDVYVSTSQHEGFGLVYLEAMHCGLPIVCYDRGGQNDFLRDGQTGFLVTLNDRGVFTNRCRQLIDSPELRTAMGRTNRALVEQFYIDACARRYEEVFEQVLASRGRLQTTVGVAG